MTDGATIESRPRATTLTDWTAPQPPPCLAAGCIHLWRFPVETDPDRLAALLEELDAAQRAHASKLSHPARRAEYITTRAALRRLLVPTLQALDLPFVISEGVHGKPTLPTLPGRTVHFNLAHSHGLCVVAITRDLEIGIDVEWLDRPFSFDRVVARYFSPAEQASLAALPEAEWRTGFFRIWCRKEAIVKAHGNGITLGLSSFDVSVDPSAPPAILAVRPPAGGDATAPKLGIHWGLADLDLGPGYAGALAAQGPIAALQGHALDPVAGT